MPKPFVGITLVGQIGAGKSVVARYLETKGFKLFRFSDAIKIECLKQGIKSPSRTQLQDMGDKLRKEKGPQILAKLLWQEAQKYRNIKVIFDGARNPAEVQFLKQQGAFVVGVTADAQTRFRRILERGNEADAKTWEEFLRHDSRELGMEQEEYGQNLKAALALADIIIQNNGSLNNLRSKLRESLHDLIEKTGP